MALIYVIIALFAGGGAVALKVLIFLVFPLGCIWFGDAMGGYTGMMRFQPITSQSPGCMVRFMGWVLLLFPIIIGIIMGIIDLI